MPRVRRPRPRARRARTTALGWLLLGSVAFLLFAGGVWVGRRSRSEPLPRMGVALDAPGSSTAERAGESPARASRSAPSVAGAAITAGSLDEPVGLPAPRPPVADRPAYVALVIDDLGRRLEDVDALAGLGVELSYAVLPFEARTADVVARLRRDGAELLLHLPMEPDGAADPGPGALRRSMDEAELARLTRAALDAVPGAVGVNNHMGSALSEDDRAMRVILTQVGERDLFYLDSRTSARSVGFELARRNGIAAARRDVFLDGTLEEDAIRGQFHRLLEVAREGGAAVAIGHPHPETLAVLREEITRALALGYRFVPVSYVVERTGGE